MKHVSAVAIFCDDVRQEHSGQNTLVGTLPDNLLIQGRPPTSPNEKVFLPKLGVYIRINFNTDGDKPKDISAKVLNTNGDIITQAGWDSNVIDKAFADSKTNQLPLVGLLLRSVTGPLPIPRSGKITAIVSIDGVDHLAGALNVIISSSTASEQPVSQSASAPSTKA